MLRTLTKMIKFTFTLGTGLASGVILGMLLAPKSGKELRKDISGKAVEVKEKAVHKLEKVVEDKGLSKVRIVGHAIRDIADKMCLKIDSLGSQEKSKLVKTFEEKDEYAVF